MKLYINNTGILIVLLLSVFSSRVFADRYQYHADVKGMVCAFCAYSVSKNISKLPGVDADSVNVDLKGGQLDFTSSQQVSEKKISALFNESGFTVSNLSYRKISKNTAAPSSEITLDLSMDVFKLDPYLSIIETIGNIAARTSARVIIKAPVAYEDSLLKPLLMGRQQVVKVRFIPIKADTIHLQLEEMADSGRQP